MTRSYLIYCSCGQQATKHQGLTETHYHCTRCDKHIATYKHHDRKEPA